MSERLIEILVSSFTKILIPGIKVTIPLTICSFLLSLVLALFLALVQVANVRVLKQISQIYIWIFRGTPLIVQLFIIFSVCHPSGLCWKPSLPRCLLLA